MATTSENSAAGGRALMWGGFSLVVAVILGCIGWMAPGPGAMGEPRELGRLLGGLVVIREGGKDRVAEFGEADQKSATYAINRSSRMTSSVRREFGVDVHGTSFVGGAKPMVSLGLYQRMIECRQSLSANRIDGKPDGAERKESVDEQMLASWRPLIREYLNTHRTAERGGGRAGDRVEVLLSTPEIEETWWCWQNVCIVGAYAAGLMGVVMLGAGVVKRMMAVPEYPEGMEG